MAYIINRYNGEELVVLDDGTLDISTSIGLLGRNYVGYGEVQNENFLYLLENFSNISPPVRPLSGQLWYDTANSSLNVYDGSEWTVVGTASVGESSPPASPGALWLKSQTNQLFVYNQEWNLIGPESVEGFGVSKIRTRKVIDNTGVYHVVLEVIVDDVSIALISKDEFTISDTAPVDGYLTLSKGINLSTESSAGTKLYTIIGNLTGNASSADRLYTPRRINGQPFDGQTDITITSNTTNSLTRGTYLTGSNFNGSAATTWAVDASSNNVIGKIVARDSAGDFSAGTITADLEGNVTGDIVSEGTSTFNIIEANTFIGNTLTGNAATATRLENRRTINGVIFDGTENITVTAAANTLTGNTLNPGVINSTLQTVGRLDVLRVSDGGAFVGNNDSLKLSVDGSENPEIISNLANKTLNLKVSDTSIPGNYASIKLISASTALAAGGTLNPAMVPGETLKYNLGISTLKWKTVYSEVFSGTATTAQYADLAEKYVADGYYEPGMVVMFGGTAEVTLADNETPRVAGVISTDPAYLMNSDLHATHVAAVALQGRVPCFVKGPVKKGEMLVSAGDGYAKAAGAEPKLGTVIGKSLADFDGLTGTIEIVVGRL